MFKIIISLLRSISNTLDKIEFNGHGSWTGTKAEYNEALESGIITPDTVCYVTDDISDLILEIPTASPEDIGLCKPDNSFVSIDETGTLKCPLNSDYIVAKGVSEDKKASFVKWNSGRLEQWGVASSYAAFSAYSSVQMPQAFINTNYSIIGSIRTLMNGFMFIMPLDNLIIKYRVTNPNGAAVDAEISWRADGYWK